MSLRTTIKQLLRGPITQEKVDVRGWIRTKRTSKKVVFLTLNDGSCQPNLQVVMEVAQLNDQLLGALTTGASVMVVGQMVSVQAGACTKELRGEQLTLLGNAPGYPLQPKPHSLEFLRTVTHLRFRTNTFGAIFRIRHAVSYAIHHFFHEQGFFYIHTPIITTADAEGAGELFRVTTLNGTNISHTPTQQDASTDFFKKPAYLTVSGQLAAEAAAMGLGAVYTFGPTFRAENSNTSRHLAEFWMIEPEVAFNRLEENIELAKALLNHLLTFTIDHCGEELDWLNKRLASEKAKPSQNIIENLHLTLEKGFHEITYTEAIEILSYATDPKKVQFVHPIRWGIDLQSEHERYLTEVHFRAPVIVINYPKAIKAFYMRANSDHRTVAAMDILLPGIGEVIGGSEREEREDYLKRAMESHNVAPEMLNWYLETRCFGSAPHSGFGLGLERLLLFITGMSNVRDIIPFPRTPGHAEG